MSRDITRGTVTQRNDRLNETNQNQKSKINICDEISHGINESSQFRGDEWQR
jgi:hypothetical protein